MLTLSWFILLFVVFFRSKKTVAIAVFCILLLATPYAITSLDSSSLTIVDDELSDDSTQVILKIRESGSLWGSADVLQYLYQVEWRTVW